MPISCGPSEFLLAVQNCKAVQILIHVCFKITITTVFLKMVSIVYQPIYGRHSPFRHLGLLSEYEPTFSKSGFWRAFLGLAKMKIEFRYFGVFNQTNVMWPSLSWYSDENRLQHKKHCNFLFISDCTALFHLAQFPWLTKTFRWNYTLNYGRWRLF